MVLSLARALIPTGTMQSNDLPSFPITVNGSQVSTSLAFDGNWRWVRQANSTTNCYTNSWVSQYCPNDATCTKNCLLEGIPNSQWSSTYGVSVPSSGAIQINYVTVNPYGTNVGDRLYVVNAAKNGYQPFYLLGSEIRFTVDVSQLPCGVNGAVYLVATPPANSQAAFGVGYGDAQCPTDLKVVNSTFNVAGRGVCAPEIDLWEANQWATQATLHPCSVDSATVCTTNKTCGQGSNRNQGLCDMDGADWNPYRNGLHAFYGPGSNYTIDTTQPFTVATQFWTNSTGSLVRVQRYYVQNGKTIQSFNQTDATIAAQKSAYGEANAFAAHGGMAKLTAAMARGMVLVLSEWDDSAARMAWLDSIDGTGAGAVRGPCPASSGDPTATRAAYPNSKVTYSNVQIFSLSSPTPSPTPTPTPTPTCPVCLCGVC